MDLLWICYAWVWPLGVRYETAMGPRWICGGSAMGRPWVWHGPPMAPLCVSNLPAIMDPSQTCCLHDVRLHGYAVCMLWAAKRAWTLRWVRHEKSALCLLWVRRERICCGSAILGSGLNPLHSRWLYYAIRMLLGRKSTKCPPTVRHWACYGSAAYRMDYEKCQPQRVADVSVPQ